MPSDSNSAAADPAVDAAGVHGAAGAHPQPPRENDVGIWIGIGVGLGIPLVATAIVASGLLVWRQKKRVRPVALNY